MTTKKGQGLSLNTVIIAIIVLVVLVVLVMIFTGYFGKVFTPAVQSCESALAGTCKDTCTTDEGVLKKYTSVEEAKKAGCITTTVISHCCKPTLGGGF